MDNPMNRRDGVRPVATFDGKVWLWVVAWIAMAYPDDGEATVTLEPRVRVFEDSEGAHAFLDTLVDVDDIPVAFASETILVDAVERPEGDDWTDPQGSGWKGD